MSITLREVTLDDASLLNTWKHDPYLIKHALEFDYNTSLEQQQEDIKRALGDHDQDYRIILSDQTPIGYIRINFIDPHHKVAWLRFALGEQRGQGFSKLALQLLMQDLIKKGIHRVEAEVYQHNRASIKTLERLNFFKEGTKRQAHYNGEKWIDVHVFGWVKP